MDNKIVIDETFKISTLYEMYIDRIIEFNEKDTIQDDFDSSITVDNLINNTSTFSVSLNRKSGYKYTVKKGGKKLSAVLRYMKNEYSLKLWNNDYNKMFYFEQDEDFQLLLKIRKIKVSVTIDKYTDYYLETLKNRYEN